MVDNTEERALQEPAAWDDDSAEILPPVKAPRAIVSVAFARPDFERVAEYARRHGMKTSEFIRAAALERATDQTPPRSVILSITDGRGGFQGDGFNRTGGGQPVRGEFGQAHDEVVTTNWS